MRAYRRSINGYLYERRFGEGTQYPLIVRRRAARGADEEIVLDVGVLAAAPFPAMPVRRLGRQPRQHACRLHRRFQRRPRISHLRARDRGRGHRRSRYRRARPPASCSPPTTARSSMCAMSRKPCAPTRSGGIASAAPRATTCWSTRSAIQPSAFRSIFPNHANSSCSTSTPSDGANSATCPSISRPGNSGSSSRAGAASSTRPTMSATNSSSAPISTRPTSG